MLRIYMDQDRKIAEIWLTKAESNDPDVEQKLKPFYKKCKDHKFLAVVYRSGKEDLLDATKGLICHNYNNCINPQQIQKQNAAGVG